MYQVYNGLDVSVNARLKALTIQGGTSTGRTLRDNCAVRSILPETYPWSTLTVTQSLRGDSVAGLTRPYCRIVEPFQTSFRGLATYIIPKVDVQLSGTWRSDAGNEIQANYVVTSAIANSGPQPLGRTERPDAVAGLADDRYVRRLLVFEERPQGGADGGLVVGDQHPDGLGAAAPSGYARSPTSTALVGRSIQLGSFGRLPHRRQQGSAQR